MKLISLNVECFKANNLKLSKFLNKQRIDIACFQEVTTTFDNKADKKYITKGSIDAATTDLKYEFFGHTDVFDRIKLDRPHENGNEYFDPKGLLEMGNYIRSKFKILKSQNIFLEGSFSKISDHEGWPDMQRRAISVIDLYLNRQNLRIINYHGIWTKDKKGNSKTLNACRRILGFAMTAKGKVFVCGDFNLLPKTPSMEVFQKKLVSLIDKFDIQTTRPEFYKSGRTRKNVVDYIFASEGIKIKGFEVVDSGASDHLALMLDFDL